jgi:23S rRNA (uracil1939-C5)-methyltransferase
MPKAPRAVVLEGRVRDLTHGGDAVLETEQGIVMARGALPGERARVQLLKRSAGVARGRLLELLEVSPERVEPVCEIVERCGGCPLMSLGLAAQRAWKRERLQRVLQQCGSSLVPELIAGSRPLAYRARARLAWSADGGAARSGYRAAGSKALVETHSCQVLEPALAQGYRALRERLVPLLRARGEIALGLGGSSRCVAELVSDDPQPASVYETAAQLVEAGELHGLSLRIGHDAAPATWGDPRQRAVGADGTAVLAPAGGFIQVNPEVNALLVAHVQALAQTAGAVVLELYAGHGNLTLALAPGAAELLAVESEPAAAEACRQNLQARGLSLARVVCDDAARGAQGKRPVDVVVLDPPRSGARDALPAIVARRPARIIYVSCDLSTLRRDLRELQHAGYALDSAAAFDMFPQTSHLESVVRLIRARAE